MTKTVSITSLEAYRNNEHYFKNVQQGQVLRLIYENPHLTRLELHLLSIEKHEEDITIAEIEIYLKNEIEKEKSKLESHYKDKIREFYNICKEE